jgi:hypothetical protein
MSRVPFFRLRAQVELDRAGTSLFMTRHSLGGDPLGRARDDLLRPIALPGCERDYKIFQIDDPVAETHQLGLT